MKFITPVFRRCEIVLHSQKAYDNPFLDVNIDAVFTDEAGTRIALPGFWNGENEWKVRFIAQKPGKWLYTVTCTDKDNASLTDSGTVTVTAAEPRSDLEKHGYVVIPEGKRYFTYADGTPFFYLGDTHWQMPDYERLHECNYPGCTCGNQFKHLVDDRVKKGFTVYQTYFDSAESDGGGNKHVHHWWQEKFTRINPQAFNDSMDVMIDYLAENGITTALGMGVHTGTMNGFHGDAAPLLAFTRYCVARYACYPVMWLTAQEITNPPGSAYPMWKQVGELVGRLDGFHRPNGAHMSPMWSNNPLALDLDKQAWHQVWFLQAGHGGVEQLRPRSFYKSYYENKKIKPFLESECHYEDLYCSSNGGICEAQRIGAWKAIQCGAAGFTYGVTGVWAMSWNTTDDRGWRGYSPEPWYIGMDKPGSAEMRYLKEFYEYVGWPDIEPAWLRLGRFEDARQITASHRGQDVLIYQIFAPCEPIDGTLTGFRPGVRYQARWFDPIHGAFIDLPDVISADGTAPIPQRPSLRDWILLYNRVDLGPYKTFTFPVMSTPLATADATPGEVYPIRAIRASSADEAHPAENMIDGKDDTYWQGFAAKTSQTILADLGEEKALGYLRLVCREPEYRFIRYRVYGSNDAQNWSLLSERPTDEIAIGGQYATFYEPLAGFYRYIKFCLMPTQQTPQLRLTEFAVCETLKE